MLIGSSSSMSVDLSRDVGDDWEGLSEIWASATECFMAL